MNAKIKIADGKFYDSAVFAIIYDSWKSKCVVFDQTLQKLEIINMWHDINIRRKVFIMDDSTTVDWVENDSIEGYSWLLENDNLNRVEKGELSSDIIKRCKEIQQAVSLPLEFEIKTAKDVKILMNVAYDFHDSFIEKVETADTTAKVTINNKGWGAIIHFKLENPQFSLLFKEGYGKYGEIFTASMFFGNGRIYWVNDLEIDSTQLASDLSWFSSTRVFVKIELI